MKFPTYEGCRFLPVDDLPRLRTHLLHFLEIRDPKFLDEVQEPEPEPIKNQECFEFE